MGSAWATLLLGTPAESLSGAITIALLFQLTHVSATLPPLSNTHPLGPSADPLSSGSGANSLGMTAPDPFFKDPELSLPIASERCPLWPLPRWPPSNPHMPGTSQSPCPLPSPRDCSDEETGAQRKDVASLNAHGRSQGLNRRPFGQRNHYYYRDTERVRSHQNLT